MSVNKKGFLDTRNKETCFGCEACAQVCPKNAITMQTDDEGFGYPFIDNSKCIKCDLCHKVCPYENPPEKFDNNKQVLGGCHKDIKIRNQSTSGGAFSAIMDVYNNGDSIVFGAVADGVKVYHKAAYSQTERAALRKSKYLQSEIGSTFQQVKDLLKKEKHVIFSGTPCQIAGLKSFLQNTDISNLLTVEVVCEGVPTPLFINKYADFIQQKYGAKVIALDYRYKDNNKWDFQVMRTELSNGKIIKKDRWFNPFWSIWLNHLMSRPSCYKCPFTTIARSADITLGDLWGVHLYCPELYANNTGSSLIIANTPKGKDVLCLLTEQWKGHSLDFTTALKYQKPLRNPITYNEDRPKFMQDLIAMDYEKLCRIYTRKPTLKLLFSKYLIKKRPWIWWTQLKTKFIGEKNA